MHTVGDILIPHKQQLRRIAQGQAMTQLPADKARAALERSDHALGLVILQDAYIHLGVAKIARDLRPGDTVRTAQTGIMHILADDLVRLAANLLGDHINAKFAQSLLPQRSISC